MDRIKYLDLDKLFPNRRCSYWKYSPVQRNGKWGLVNEKGNSIVPCEFDKPIYWNKISDVDSKLSFTPVILQTIGENNILTSYILNEEGKVLCSYKRKHIEEKI